MDASLDTLQVLRDKLQGLAGDYYAQRLQPELPDSFVDAFSQERAKGGSAAGGIRSGLTEARRWLADKGFTEFAPFAHGGGAIVLRTNNHLLVRIQHQNSLEEAVDDVVPQAVQPLMHFRSGDTVIDVVPEVLTLDQLRDRLSDDEMRLVFMSLRKSLYEQNVPWSPGAMGDDPATRFFGSDDITGLMGYDVSHPNENAGNVGLLMDGTPVIVDQDAYFKLNELEDHDHSSVEAIGEEMEQLTADKWPQVFTWYDEKGTAKQNVLHDRMGYPRIEALPDLQPGNVVVKIEREQQRTQQHPMLAFAKQHAVMHVANDTELNDHGRPTSRCVIHTTEEGARTVRAHVRQETDFQAEESYPDGARVMKMSSGFANQFLPTERLSSVHPTNMSEICFQIRDHDPAVTAAYEGHEDRPVFVPHEKANEVIAALEGMQEDFDLSKVIHGMRDTRHYTMMRMTNRAAQALGDALGVEVPEKVVDSSRESHVEQLAVAVATPNSTPDRTS